MNIFLADRKMLIWLSDAANCNASVSDLFCFKQFQVLYALETRRSPCNVIQTFDMISKYIIDFLEPTETPRRRNPGV